MAAAEYLRTPKRTVLGDRKGTHWTEHEIKILQWTYGHVHLYRIAKKLGRSEQAVATMARRLGLVGAQVQGRTTVSDLAKSLGYDRSTIIAIARSLGIELRTMSQVNPRRRHRRGAGKRYALSDHQVEIITARLESIGWGSRNGLRAGEWGLFREHCAECGTTESPHHAHGLCKNCYWIKKSKERRAAAKREQPLVRGVI